MSRRKKATFILKVDANLVNTKYDFDLVSNLLVATDDSTQNLTTAISDLPTARDSEAHAYSFLDESKQLHTCVATMKDLLSGSQLPKHTDVCCFWCKFSMATSPIGCPVSYLSNKVTKTYHSEITKDKYQITDNLTKKRKARLKTIVAKHKSLFTILDNHSHHFVVDGLFCSFNCCMAFVKDNRGDEFYNLSESLLYTMYKDIFNTPIEKINPAPDWRLLTKFGGPLTITEFRKSFNSIQYNDIDDYIIRSLPTRMIGKLYEKKVKF